jgi:hypothetical protein
MVFNGQIIALIDIGDALLLKKPKIRLFSGTTKYGGSMFFCCLLQCVVVKWSKSGEKFP